MIKLISPMSRKDLMPRDEFAEYYVYTHTRKAKVLPGLVKYVGSPAIQSANGDAPPWDAVAEMYWPDITAMTSQYQQPVWDEVRTDHQNMIAGRTMWLAEEHEFLAPPEFNDADDKNGSIKYLAFLNRKDAMPIEDFKSYWYEQHVPLALETPGLIGYRGNVSIRGTNDDAPAFDGTVEMWFEDVASFEASFRDPHWDKLRADYYDNFAMGRVQLLVEENRVMDKTNGPSGS